MHLPTWTAGLWWADLGNDSDLARYGVVLDAPKLAEIRAHNTRIEQERRRARRNEGARKAAKTTRERRKANRGRP